MEISPNAFWSIFTVLLLAVIGGAVGYGILIQKVNGLCKCLDALSLKVEALERRGDRERG